MDTKKCEAFLIAAETGSFTAAARHLGYTQVGITRLIAGLEEELGFSLFLRSKKGVALTENGKLMLPVLRELVSAGRTAEQLGADILGTVRGVLSIGSCYSVSSMWLPEILSRFQKKYPAVRLRMLEGGNREMSRWLSEKSVDCCFLAEPAGAHCDWIPLFRDEIVAWLPPDHPLAHAGAFPIDRILRESFIHTQPGEDTELDRILEKLPGEPDVCYTTRDAFTAWNMVAAGLGISLNQRLISEKWTSAIAEVPLDPPQYVSLGIAVPSRKEASPAAIKFIDCVLESLPGLTGERTG